MKWGWDKARSASAAALALAGLGVQSAIAQDVVLPPVDVSSTRIGNSGAGSGIGIVGASNTVITAADIERAPELTVQEIISREAGVQTTTLYGGVNGAGNSSAVDLRGFGVTAPSNTLVLVDGRRFNDSDLTGFDFSLIPRNAIERIEITRGNSGAVLYGDGAVGGVINIVTKNAAGAKPFARIEGSAGTFNTKEANFSGGGSHGPFSAAAFVKDFESNGYRTNNKTIQKQAVGDLRYVVPDGSVFLNMSGDNLSQRLPGPRNITNGLLPFFGPYNEYATDRRGTNTPFDYFFRTNQTIRGGVTRNVWNGTELILDGSIRRKQTEFGSFTVANNPFGAPNVPSSYNTTELTTYSVTPRVNFDQIWGNVRARMIAGVDVYKTNYDSNRANFMGAPPNHVYNFDQQTTGVYAQPTLTFWDNTDFSFGGRVQHNIFNGTDAFDPTAPQSPSGVAPAAANQLHTGETDHAWHAGFEHRFGPVFAIFGRVAQSFRVPNIDERVGATAVFVPTTFDLRTQRSHDYEGGFKFRWSRLDVQSSIYNMNLTDELHYSPITGANTNLDPTRRHGWETTATWALSETVRVKGTASYTRAVFRSGVFAGNDVPEVARWSGSTGVAWDIYRKYLTMDVVARYAGRRFIDGDEINRGVITVLPYTLWDLRVGGEIDRFFWSISVQNLFNKAYFDYALDTSFPGTDFISVYPLPGRVFLAKAGANF
jgi:iron complex outermembrane receptor protein